MASPRLFESRLGLRERGRRAAVREVDDQSERTRTLGEAMNLNSEPAAAHGLTREILQDILNDR
jgi:hypothetical protein